MSATKTITPFNESRYAAWLSAIGDSQSDYANGYGVRPSNSWLPRLTDNLRRRGANVRGRAFGISGDTSANTLARADVLFLKETPDVGLIYIGVNDPGASITQAQTQANIQAQIKVLKHGAVGVGGGLNGTISVANPASLPAGSRLGQRIVVLADNDTTGGAAPQHPSSAARITGSVAGGGQAVWECDNTLGGVYGWHRVAVDASAPTKCKKVVVVSTNYLNFTTGGDTPSTPYAAYAPVRAAQQAAVAAENVTVNGKATVIYADLYTHQKTRIVGGTFPASGTPLESWTFAAGTDPDFTSVAYDQTRSWHYVLNNQHHNAYGQMLVALTVENAMVNAGWLPDFPALVNPAN